MGRPKGSASKQRLNKGELGRRKKMGDPAQFRRRLSWVAATYYNGSWRAMEKAAGLPPDSLRPYKEERYDGITERIERAILRLAQLHRLPSLLWAYDRPDQWRVLLEYWRWRDRRCSDYVTRTDTRWEMAQDGPQVLPAEPVSEIQARRIGELHYLLGLIQSRYPDLINELRRAFREHHHIDEDERAGTLEDMTPVSYSLSPQLYHALIRIVTPLLETRESAFMERGWEELLTVEQSSKEGPLRDFVAAGVEREVILLNREDDSERVKDLPSELLSDKSTDWIARMESQYASSDSWQRTMWLHMLNRMRGMAQDVQRYMK